MNEYSTNKARKLLPEVSRMKLLIHNKQENNLIFYRTTHSKLDTIKMKM